MAIAPPPLPGQPPPLAPPVPPPIAERANVKPLIPAEDLEMSNLPRPLGRVLANLFLIFGLSCAVLVGLAWVGSVRSSRPSQPKCTYLEAAELYRQRKGLYDDVKAIVEKEQSALAWGETNNCSPALIKECREKLRESQELEGKCRTLMDSAERLMESSAPKPGE
jgi:hypothetical protein